MIKSVLKSIAFAALFWGGASPTWAQNAEEVSITIGQSTGTFTQTNAAKTWAREWASQQSDPQLVLSCAQNNMAFYDGENVKLFTNKGNSFKANYTLTASAGWAVQSYSFEFTADTESGRVSVTPAGKTAVTASGLSEKQSISVELPKASRSISFEVSNQGAADFARTSNFVVKLVKKEIEDQKEVMVTKVGTIPYRIPALAVAGKSGHLIAVGDYRHSRADIGSGRVDLHVARSENHGDSWTAPTDPLDKNKKPVALGNSGTERNSAFGDPAIVGDIESDTLLMLSVSGHVPLFSGLRANPNPAARWYSPDGGKTWTQHEDITEHIYSLFDGTAPSGYIDSMFFGSGRIFQSSTTKVGTHYRVYAALSGYVKATGIMACWVLYSDDFGKNWKVLGDPSNPPVPAGGDEPKVEELPDGNIVISARAYSGRNYNIFAFEDVATAKGVWGQHAFSTKKKENGIIASSNACNGEILILPVKRLKDNKKMHLALQSVPFGPSGRTRVGINYKELAVPTDYNSPSNFAKGWDGDMVVTELASAYSTMVLQKDEKVGFFYEEDTYNTTGSGGYTLVYKKYSVEDITGGTYAYDPTVTRPTTDPNLATAVDVAAAREVLKKKGVGYPSETASERAELQALLTKAESENTVTKAEVQAAIEKLRNSSDIELPAHAQFYTLSFVAENGQEYYLNHTATQREYKQKVSGEELPLSAMFVAEKAEDGKITLFSLRGKYLSLNGELIDEKDAQLAPITISKLSAGEQVALTGETAYGLVALQSASKAHNGALRYWGIDVAQSQALDNVEQAVVNKLQTVAVRFELTTPPLGATVTNLEDVKGDKAYALYNAHFTTFAIKKEGQNNIWAAGMKGDAGHPLSNAEFAQAHSTISPLGAWQLIRAKDGQWYLYNIGANEFVKTGTPSTFTTAQDAINVTPLNGGFAFNSGIGENNFLCAAPQLSDKPLASWKSTDLGSKWVLIENPYVEPNIELFNTLTAIQQLKAQDAVRKGIYNLAGQRINATEVKDLLPAGLYIIDGKKHIVR